MIIVITYREDGQEKVSHGIDENFNHVVLPYGVAPRSLGATLDEQLLEWILS